MLKFLFCALALVSASVAHATTMVHLDLDAQAERSSAFVSATVGGSTIVHTERMVYTDTELLVEDVLGGAAPTRIVIRQAGGFIGDKLVQVPGDAELYEGDRVFAFVRQVEGRWYLTALGQSVWHVEPSGELIRDLDHGALMERAPDGRIVPGTQSPLELVHEAQVAASIRPLVFGGAQ